MTSRIVSASAPGTSSSSAQENPSPAKPSTSAKAWLVLALRKDLDLNGDGKLSFKEFSQGRTSGNISGEHQAELAQMDQTAFDALEQTDGVGDGRVDFAVLAGNKHLVDQIAYYGNPLPSDFLLSSLTASGQIADPSALTPDEQKKLADLSQKLCTSGFDSLTLDEKTVVQRAATNLLRLDSSLGGLAAGTEPTPDQLSTAITTLTQRIGYETGTTPVASGVDPKNFDYQSLLGGGTGSDQLSLFAYNSVANQVKAEAGSLGQTDQIGTIYVPYLQQERSNGGLLGGTTDGAEEPMSAEQQAFVDEWTQTNGPITSDNVGQLTTDLAAKFPPEAGWSFQTKQISNPWVGQLENLGTLQGQANQAYRDWNANGTPKVISPTHRAQALIQELQAKQQAFAGAVSTLNDPKAWAIMDYLEGKSYDWKNDFFGDSGLGKLADLSPDSPEWDQLANDRNDRAVPYEERQKYIDAAKLATSPEQADNLDILRVMGEDETRYNKEDWQSWLDGQADVAPYAQATQMPSAAQQDFSVAASTLNNPSAWALMDLLEGPTTDMHNDLVGDNGLGKLAQLSPESAEWDQLPADKAVPDKATRQAMIDAAKIILSPEQTANRDVLRALGDNPEYNREDWQGWLDAQPPALYDLNHWMGRLSQGAGDILKPIHVDRDRLSTGVSVVMGIFTLGIGNAIHTGTHKPGYSAEQQFVVDQLRAQGRDPTVLEKAMEEARDEWTDAVWESAVMAGAGVAMALIPGIGVTASAVSRAAATAARVGGNALGATGRVVGGAVGAVVSVVDQAVIGGLGNLFTTLGAKVPAAARAAWDSLVKRAGEGARPQELASLARTAQEGLEGLPPGTLMSQGTSLLTQVKELAGKLRRASEAEAALAAPTTPKSPAQLAGQDLAGVAWSNASQTRGKVTVNGQSFDVVKTVEGQVLTGKFEQGESRFKALDASTGQPTGALLYKADDGSGWFQGGLKGGMEQPEVADGTAAAALPDKLELAALPENVRAKIWAELGIEEQLHILSTDKGLCKAFGEAAATIEMQGEHIVTAMEILPNLDHIKLTGFVTPEQLQLLENAQSLKSLDMSGVVNFTDELYNVLNGMGLAQRLRSLAIPSVKVPGDRLAALAAGAPNIERITVTGPITPEQLAALSEMPNLKSLDLSLATGLTDDCVRRLEQLPLESLNLSNSTAITDAALASIERLPNLKSLDLSGCTKVRGQGLANLQTLEHLENLNLSGCTGIGSGDIEHLGALVQLKSLTLGDMHRLAYDRLARPGPNRPSPLLRLQQLESLDFSDTRRFFGNDNLPVLMELPNLRNLNVRGCDEITEEGLTELRNRQPPLNIQGPGFMHP